MTREEAIYELEGDMELYIPLGGTVEDVDRDLPDGRLITALEMAIGALETPKVKEHIDPERLVQMIRYSSQYNQPCPEWVYDVIRHS